MKRTLDYEVKGQRPMRTWKKLVQGESAKVGLRWVIHFAY